MPISEHQTGRTTRMVHEAINRAIDFPESQVDIIGYSTMFPYTRDLILNEFRERGYICTIKQSRRSIYVVATKSTIRFVAAESDIRNHLEGIDGNNIFVDHAVRLDIEDAEFIKYIQTER